MKLKKNLVINYEFKKRRKKERKKAKERIIDLLSASNASRNS